MSRQSPVPTPAVSRPLRPGRRVARTLVVPALALSLTATALVGTVGGQLSAKPILFWTPRVLAGPPAHALKPILFGVPG